MKNCILAVGLLSSLAAFGGLAGPDALSDHLWFFADFDSPALAGDGLFSAEFDPSGYRDGKFGRGYYFRRGAKNDLLPMASFLADRANFTNAVNLVCAPGRLTLTAAGSFSVVPQPLRAGFSAARPRTGYAMSFYVKGAKGTKVTLTPSLGGVPEKTVREFVKKNPKFDWTKALKDEVGAVEYVLRGEGFERVCVTPVFDARLTAGRTVSLKVTASAKVEMERFQYQQVAVYPYHDIFLPTVWVDGGATVPETRLTLGDMDLVRSFPVRRGGFSVWFRRDETMPAYTNFPCNFWGCNPIYNNLRSANATDFVTDSHRSCVRLPSKRRLQADTAWHHAAGSWSDKGLFYYLDGELVASNVSDRIVFADPAAVGRGHSVYVGGGYAGSGGSEAILDELAVYSVDLGADDVRRLYEAKRGLLADTKRLFGGEVEFTTFFRNDEGAVLRPKVSAPADGEWRLEATVGGIRVASRMVALKRGANVIDIPFDPAKYAPGRHAYGWTLSAGGRVALAREGEVTICPRKERDGFRIVSWGGFDPGAFASTMGFDTHVLWSSNPLGIRKVVNSGNFVNIRYENAREWRGVDCDFDAIERTSEAALSRWKGLYGWWGTLVCSEVYGIWNAISAREFPSYRRLAERQLGFKPKFSIGPSHPGNVDFAELGVKPPFKGVIGHDNAALETFRWFCDHGDPVVFSNARVKDAVHRLSPGNVVWTEPCCGTGGMFRELDGFADWYYSYSTRDVLGGLVATASPARRFNIRHQPTLTTWYGDNYGGPHPHRLGKDGKPELVRVSQTADELIVKSWMAIAASRADSLCFWNAGQWIKGIEGAEALAASPTNEVKYVADRDAPAKYGAFIRERFLPAAELFKGVGNVRAPVALVSRAVTQYATHWGWGHYHYHRQLRSALINVGLPVDQLGDLEFTPEVLSQYRYLVLPMSFLAYDDEAAALKAAAEKGTVVVQDAEPAVRYPNDLCLTGLNYRVNRPVETCRPLLDWYTNRTEELRAMLPAWSSCDGKDGYTFVKEYKGVRYVTVVNDRRRDGGGLMTEIRTNATYRPYCAPQRITTTLRGVPKGAKVYEFNADGKGLRVESVEKVERDFKAAEGVVYCVYPRALKAPELSTEGAFKAGGKATLVVKIRDIDGKPAPGRQIVRLEFAAPDGTLTDESGLYTVEDGEARIVLRFPAGAPSGTRFSGWKATVTDLTSGEKASLGFILEGEEDSTVVGAGGGRAQTVFAVLSF